jgi:protoporphyrinogen oxidase
MILILGAGLSGISCSYHLNHDCVVIEKNNHAGGHIFSRKINEFIWDEGPHVSFTKNQYVKDLLALSLDNEFLEYPVFPVNYYKGNWVPHPAQSNLFAIPEPIKSEMLKDFLASRANINNDTLPKNYQEWLEMAFGKVFANELPASYTRKYWTVEPKELSTDWVGERVFFPDVETVKKGYLEASNASNHYITSVRYPKHGGYYSYTNLLQKGINIQYNKVVKEISLENKVVYFTDGSFQNYEKLINTLPLDNFVKFINAPDEIKRAAESLSCSELLLINFEVNHTAQIDSHWLYVYDEDKYATRINFTELLSPNNGPQGKCGIQVEVYFSKFKPQLESTDLIIEKVINELIEMNLLKSLNDLKATNSNYVKYANIIFDHQRKESLDSILNYLSKNGLVRESDDLEPTSNWNNLMTEKIVGNNGNLYLAGRFAQWKYYWTDDCILRGKLISSYINN